MAFNSKLKINLYYKHFHGTLEKYTRFPKFTLLFSISYVRINGEDMRESLLPSSLFALSHSLNRFLYKRLAE